MGGSAAERHLYGLFAQLLEYPRGDVVEAARACRALLGTEHAEAAALMAEFIAMAEAAPPGRLEEIYTGTFDLNGACYPYIGYHLLGESYKRSVLLIELKQRYRAVGLDPGTEVADHVALVLRFLSALDDAGEARELAGEALLPALQRMTRKAEAGGEPAASGPEAPDPADAREAYHRVLHALRLALERHAGAGGGDRADEPSPSAMTAP